MSNTVQIENLRKELELKDARIKELEQRVAEMEKLPAQAGARGDYPGESPCGGMEFKMLADSIPGLILRINPELELIFVNSAVSRFTGRGAESYIGERVTAIFNGAGHEKLIGKVVSDVARTGKVITVELNVNNNGSEHTFESQFMPEYSPDGKVISILSLSRDITIRKNFETEILKSKSEWERTFDTVPDLIALLDRNSKIIRANNAMAQEFGTNKFSLLGKYCYDVFHCCNNLDPDKCPHAMMMMTGKEHVTVSTIEPIRKTFRISASPLFDDKNNLVACVHIAHDITDLVRAEQEIKQLNDELEERVEIRTREFESAMAKLESEINTRRQTELKLLHAQNELMNALAKERNLGELKSRFIDMISHEYRTPLTVIASSAYLIGKFIEMKKIEKASKHLSKISSNVRAMTAIIENALSLDFDNSRMNLNPESFELLSLIKNIINEVMLIDGNEHNVRLLTSETKIECTTDQKHLRKILVNLISNAVKYSFAGSEIVIKVDARDKRIRTEITDHGLGISEEEMPFIFDPFFRHNKHIGIIPGIGLGLTIAKRSSDVINGNIKIISELGSGTTASFEFISL